MPADELTGPRYALIVATADYRDAAFTQLRAPAQDATDIATVLADPAIGGFAVTTVLDRPEPDIRRAAEIFLADRDVDDLVLVYVSCHGVLDARGRLYFAATDTDKARLASTAIESGWLLDRLEECRARRQVLLLDCCFSGAFAHTKGDSGLDLDRRLVGAGRGRAVLTASRASEYSFEGTPLSDGTGGGSVFTAALVEGLRTGTADQDGDGYISVEDAYRYVAEQISRLGSAQSPQRWLYGGEGDTFLARSTRRREIVAATLPVALRTGLDSPIPEVRRGAVESLGGWLRSDDPARVLAARQTLGIVESQDNPLVAATARRLLSAVDVPPPPAAPERAATERPDQPGTGSDPVFREPASPHPERPMRVWGRPPTSGNTGVDTVGDRSARRLDLREVILRFNSEHSDDRIPAGFVDQLHHVFVAQDDTRIVNIFKVIVRAETAIAYVDQRAVLLLGDKTWTFLIAAASPEPEYFWLRLPYRAIESIETGRRKAFARNAPARIEIGYRDEGRSRQVVIADISPPEASKVIEAFRARGV